MDSSLTFTTNKNGNQDLPKEQTLSEAKRENNGSTLSILQLFIRYFWDKRDGVRCGNEDLKLVNWLKLMKIDFEEEFWYLSNKLDIRIASKIEFTASIKSNKNLLRKSQNFNDNVVSARIAYNMRKLLPVLIDGNNDINYTNKRNQTVLHIFFEECFKTPEKLPDNKIFQIQKLILNLMTIGASLYAEDENGKTPFSVLVLYDDKRITETIISRSNINTSDKNLRNKRGITAGHIAASEFRIDILNCLANKGADFTQQTVENETLLHHACKCLSKSVNKNKIIETVNFLISRGCNVNLANKNGYTSLHYAAESKIVEVVEILIKNGAIVDCKTTEMLFTPLYLASKNNQLDNMRLLVKAGANVDAKAIDGTSPLFMAVMLGSLESMEYLIDEGADVHCRDRILGFTLLHIAAHPSSIGELKLEIKRGDTSAKTVSKLRILIEKGINVNDLGHCNIIPLQMAVLLRNPEAVEFLVARGANVNFQSQKTEWTALHIATINHDLEIVETLIKAGSDINCRGGNDRLSLLHSLLMPYAQWTLGKYPEGIEQNERKLSTIMMFGFSTLHELPLKFDPLLTTLFDHGIDVDARDTSGKTPLHFASLFTNNYFLDKLLRAGTQVNMPDSKGQLPLHNILRNCNEQGLQLLLDYGADINDDDISKQIMNNDNKLKKIAIEHAIKLKLVGLKTARIYETSIQDPAYANFYNRCSEEVIKLINHRDSDFSLYEFLRKNVKYQHRFAEKIENSRTNIQFSFPIYSNLIQAACRESINRKKLLQSAKFTWQQISTFHLPDFCVEHIFSFLNNRYLKMFSECGNTYEEIGIAEDKIPVFGFFAKHVLSI